MAAPKGTSMAKTDFKTVDEYISTFPPDTQAVLQQVRQAIKAAVPEAEEVISYQIPALKYHGWIFYFAAFKSHFSLSCPPPFTVFDSFKDELAGYKRSKSAIQFPLDEPVPVDLISRMAEFRAAENLRLEAVKKARKRAG